MGKSVPPEPPWARPPKDRRLDAAWVGTGHLARQPILQEKKALASMKVMVAMVVMVC